MASNEPTAWDADSSDGVGGEDVFRDPETNSDITKIITDVVLSAVRHATQHGERLAEGRMAGLPTDDEAVPAQAPRSGQAVEAVADGATAYRPGRQQQEPCPQGGRASRLVDTLIKCIGNVLLDKSVRPGLELVVANVVTAVKKHGWTYSKAVVDIGRGMLQRKPSWSQLICFLAFCILLYISDAAQDAVDLMKEVVKAVRDFFVGVLRTVFVKLGGWLGFLEVYDSTNKPLNDEIDRKMKAVGFIMCIAVIAGFAYPAWQSLGLSAPSAPK